MWSKTWRLRVNIFIFLLDLYTCIPVWGKKPHYQIVLETDKHEHGNLSKKVEFHMDSYMRKINEEYDSKRKSNRLAPIRVSLIEKGRIEHYQQLEKTKSNTLQYKYKPFRTDDSVYREIMNLRVSS